MVSYGKGCVLPFLGYFGFGDWLMYILYYRRVENGERGRYWEKVAIFVGKYR
jgi:hypothetical protein